MSLPREIKTIGQRIRFLRESLGLSQDDLSEALGLDRSSVSHIENNKRELKLNDLIELSKILNLSIDQLI
ncbi:MAG: helix-turn-helix transcriptional regulator, partial [Chlamydiae bacterium]|nr:helix-turn-helix transcriptional regulator [Chlamydiota bacterium]